MSGKSYLSLEDFENSGRGNNLAKCYGSQMIEKGRGPSKIHKYLRIENGQYIYDESKMSSKDHKDAAKFHGNKADELGKRGNSGNVGIQAHEKQRLHHEKKAKEKEREEYKSDPTHIDKKRTKEEKEKKDDLDEYNAESEVS